MAFILGAAAAFAFAGYEIYCMTRKETVEFTHIPANMVSRTYGDDVYYVEDTNEFVVLSRDGYIRTYFNPDRGKAYFDKQ